MRIAQVAPLHESVPPKLYGGTERVVAFLSEELVALGHDVTVFASADSETSARLVPGTPRALRLDPDCHDAMPHHVAMLAEVSRLAEQFDIIHFHTGPLHYLLTERLGPPSITTLHGRLDLPEAAISLRAFRQHPHISISDAQRKPVPWLNFTTTIHHGLPTELLRPGSGDGGYLVFLGRISPEKRPDLAIEIAKRAGLPLRIAAKVDDADKSYFQHTIDPLLDEPLIDFIGEVTEREKQVLLGDARALLFPIDWPEPFGLVMIEAMACGTPVIAFPNGSVPEVIDDGVTGFIVNSVDQAVDAVQCVDRLSRSRCRSVFEQRFSARRMALDHEAVYQYLIDGESNTKPTARDDFSRLRPPSTRGTSRIRQVG